MIPTDPTKEFIELIFSKVRFNYQIHLKRPKQIVNMSPTLYIRTSEHTKGRIHIVDSHKEEDFRTPNQPRVMSKLSKILPKTPKTIPRQSISFEGTGLHNKNDDSATILSKQPQCMVSGEPINPSKTKNFSFPQNKVCKSPLAMYNKKLQDAFKVNDTRLLVKKSPSGHNIALVNCDLVKDEKDHRLQEYLDDPIFEVRPEDDPEEYRPATMLGKYKDTHKSVDKGLHEK